MHHHRSTCCRAFSIMPVRRRAAPAMIVAASATIVRRRHMPGLPGALRTVLSCSHCCQPDRIVAGESRRHDAAGLAMMPSENRHSGIRSSMHQASCLLRPGFPPKSKVCTHRLCERCCGRHRRRHRRVGFAGGGPDCRGLRGRAASDIIPRTGERICTVSQTSMYGPAPLHHAALCYNHVP